MNYRSGKPSRPIESVAIYGSGLALWLCAIMLDRHLPETIAVRVIDSGENGIVDFMYGTVLPPEIHRFHDELGLSEPDFLLSTQSGFAFGSAYDDWAMSGRSWVQAFHAMLPSLGGVPLPKLLAHDRGTRLQDCLVSAVAVERSVFAHPPADIRHPLSRAEYGYLVNPEELAGFYKNRCSPRVLSTKGRLKHVLRDGDEILSIVTDDEKIEADLWVDASGSASELLLGPTLKHYDVHIAVNRWTGEGLADPACGIQSSPEGWRSITQLRNETVVLEISGTSDGDHDSLTIATREEAWQANVVAIGQTAATLEPLSLAPMKLLLRDIMRLRDRFPVSVGMHIEAKDYNIVFQKDVALSRHFHLAHFADLPLPDGAYWGAVSRQLSAMSIPAGLRRKLDQYKSRGYIVNLGEEPFDMDQWAILHDGIGRSPERSDALVEQARRSGAMSEVGTISKSISAVTAKMPTHDVYMSKYLDYLKRKVATHV